MFSKGDVRKIPLYCYSDETLPTWQFSLSKYIHNCGVDEVSRSSLASDKPGLACTSCEFS